jgi:hypothetical protein
MKWHVAFMVEYLNCPLSGAEENISCHLFPLKKLASEVKKKTFPWKRD